MLSKAGFEVSLIARGDHLKAINQNGLRLIAKGSRLHHTTASN